ncbi:MAG: flagellar basal body rod C-terminal domain-containing protein [Kofleriaceae bacterium]
MRSLATGRLVTLDCDLAVTARGGARTIVIRWRCSSRSLATGAVVADGVEVGAARHSSRFPPGRDPARGRGARRPRHAAAGDADAPPTVRSGALEGSNVNIVRRVVDLVRKVLRTYQVLVASSTDVEPRRA